jgi:hypothetical protein
LRHYQFHREPLFAGLKPVDPDAEALLYASRKGRRVLEASDQAWLNRHLLEAAFRQATGRPCFRRLDSALDGILVSDVGKRMTVRDAGNAGGLIRTSMRATDIVMNRVWQLEVERFQDSPRFVFAPLTEVVEPAEDPTAIHPEIQRQAVSIRTDFDRFSPLEISSLVRHGYCVARKSCRAQPHLFGDGLPEGAPWDPMAHTIASAPPSAAAMPRHRTTSEPVPATVEARALQDSAVRRIWSTLLDHRDWTSYVYVPLLVPILVLLPYFVFKSHQRSQQLNHLVESLSQGSRDLGQMSQLLEGKQETWIGEPAEELPSFPESDYRGFGILQDSRIFDLRRWKPVKSDESDRTSLAFGYRRLKVSKQPEQAGNNIFDVYLAATSPHTAVRFPRQQLPPKLSMTRVAGANPDEKVYRWRASFDFQHVPIGEFVDLVVEYHSPGRFLQRGQNGSALAFPIRADIAELTAWILMPEGKQYEGFRIVRYKTAKPDEVEPVEVVTEYLAEELTIIAFKLLDLKAGYNYEVSWTYQ